MNHDNLLIVFVKNVEAGRVKTRLASTLGHPKALSIYEGLLRYTIAHTQRVECAKAVYYGSRIERADQWADAGFEQNVQANGDLGHRMAQALQEGFDRGYQRIILIGSDCPQLTSQILEDGFAYLNAKDAVIGPAEDGGYYLIGLSRMTRHIFDHKEWSTNTVAEEAIDGLQEIGFSCQQLPTLSDMDYEEDWLRHKDRIIPFMPS